MGGRELSVGAADQRDLPWRALRVGTVAGRADITEARQWQGSEVPQPEPSLAAAGLNLDVTALGSFEG